MGKRAPTTHLLSTQHQAQGTTVLPNPFLKAAENFNMQMLMCKRLNSVLNVIGKKSPKHGAWSVFARRETTSMIREVMKPPSTLSSLRKLQVPDQGALYLLLMNYSLITPHEQPVPEQHQCQGRAVCLSKPSLLLGLPPWIVLCVFCNVAGAPSLEPGPAPCNVRELLNTQSVQCCPRRRWLAPRHL